MTKKSMLGVHQKVPQIPHNLFGPSAQSAQTFGNSEKSSYHASIVHGFFTLKIRFWHILTAILGHLTTLM